MQPVLCGEVVAGSRAWEVPFARVLPLISRKLVSALI